MTIRLLGHFNLEPRDIEIGEHAVVQVARIIEWKL
jgi:hypothetical protein